MASVQGEIADAIVTELETPAVEGTLEQLIQTGEVQLEKIASAFLASVHPNGMLALVYPPIAASLNAAIAKAIAAHTPAELVTGFIIPLAQAEAKRLGG